jgi:hypothetical protein
MIRDVMLMMLGMLLDVGQATGMDELLLRSLIVCILALLGAKIRIFMI